MSIKLCEHDDVEANVVVIKLSEDEDAIFRGDHNRSVAEIQIRCVECGEHFGFRTPDVGIRIDRPTVSPDILELRAPLISPSELKLLKSVAVETTNMIETINPDVEDEQRWYKIQTFDKWYAIKACCRSCATRKLHAWTYQNAWEGKLGTVKTKEYPSWLISLESSNS
jgi:hypothetical protein